VQCIDDGGLVAAITERVCPTAAVGRLAAGDRVVRSCRGVALLRRWLAGAVGGLPQVVGCSGEAGSARRGCWRRSRMRRNPWGAGAFGAVGGADECATVVPVGAAIQA
jgi:hypothetical protein